MLVDIDLSQKRYQLGRFMHINAVLTRLGNDLFGDQSATLGDDTRRCIRLAICKRDSFAPRITRRSIHGARSLRPS